MSRRTVWLGILRFGVALAVYSAFAVTYRFVLDIPGRPSFWAAIVATVLVAVVLEAFQGRIGRVADRCAYGADAASHQDLRRLIDRLVSTLPVDDVVPQLAQTLARRARSARAEVRLNLEAGEQWSEVWPARSTAAGVPVTVQVDHLGARVGEIDVEPEPGEGAFDRRLLDEIARPAGLALSTVRLTIALRRRAEQLVVLNTDLARSRQRLIDVRADERRRFRDELAERVIPHIDAAAGAVGAAKQKAMITARGIFPPRLADAGLAVSLQSLRDGAVSITTTGPLEELHVHPELEAGVYFAVVTALDLVTEGSVQLVGEAGQVTFIVQGVPRHGGRDDSVTRIRDRVEAFGGSVEFGATSARLTVTSRIPQATPSENELERLGGAR